MILSLNKLKLLWIVVIMNIKSLEMGSICKILIQKLQKLMKSTMNKLSRKLHNYKKKYGNINFINLNN
jgi:hypothetical protein